MRYLRNSSSAIRDTPSTANPAILESTLKTRPWLRHFPDLEDCVDAPAINMVQITASSCLLVENIQGKESISKRAFSPLVTP